MRKKKILIIHSSMELGGAETSLLGLLQSMDYNHYEVDLLLLDPSGALMELIPKSVTLLDTPKPYRHLVLPVKDVVRAGDFAIAAARMAARRLGASYKPTTYAIKQFAHKYALPFLPEIKKQYDIAVSFIDPHIIIGEKVNASVKLGWIHFDFSGVNLNKKLDLEMWSKMDYIVNVSASCKKVFDEYYPELVGKSIVLENVLSAAFINKQSDAFDVSDEMPENAIRLLSIGRYVTQKNFDNVPEICKIIRESGLNVKWYLIGYGGSEQLIKDKISEFGMENYVVLLGKKDNPYPYIKACDIYVQPSRWEGKSVAVREAQILNKPVVITNYATSASQLTDGIDGVIVPMENTECAKGICDFINNAALRVKITENQKHRDYTNSSELQKIYELI